jgi:hypothetical protein
MAQRAAAKYAFARIMLALSTKDGALQLFFGNFAFQVRALACVCVCVCACACVRVRACVSE